MPSEGPAFPEVMAQLRVPRPIDRPRTTPYVVLADKAYSSRAIRTHLRRRGIRAVIPSPLIRSPNARSEADPAVVRLPSTARPTNSATPSSDASTNSSRARPGHPIRQDRLHLPRGTPHRRHLHLVSPMFRRFPRWGSNAAPGRPGCLGSRNGRERQGERQSRPHLFGDNRRWMAVTSSRILPRISFGAAPSDGCQGRFLPRLFRDGQQNHEPIIDGVTVPDRFDCRDTASDPSGPNSQGIQVHRAFRGTGDPVSEVDVPLVDNCLRGGGPNAVPDQADIDEKADSREQGIPQDMSVDLVTDPLRQPGPPLHPRLLTHHEEPHPLTALTAEAPSSPYVRVKALRRPKFIKIRKRRPSIR